MHIKKCFILLLVLSTLTSCFNMDRSAAEEVAEDFFVALRADNWDAALNYMQMDTSDPNNEYIMKQFLEGNQEKFGKLESWEQAGWKAERNTDAPRTVTLIYNTKYANYPATERLIIQLIDEEWKIVSIDIDPEGYIEDAIEESLPDESPV